MQGAVSPMSAVRGESSDLHKDLHKNLQQVKDA